jgi:adenylate kinase
LVHIAVGDLLRQEVAAQTEAGLKAKGFMDSGNLVPDEVVVDMVVDRLSQQDVAEAGWLLDGYPRSASQAEAINKREIRPDVFLLINVPDEEMVNRVLGRRIDPETGNIYHLQYNPPPPKIAPRLIQVVRPSDCTLQTSAAIVHSQRHAEIVMACAQHELTRRKKTAALVLQSYNARDTCFICLRGGFVLSFLTIFKMCRHSHQSLTTLYLFSA